MSNRMLVKAGKREFVIKCSKEYMEEFDEALHKAAENYKYEKMIGKKFYVFTNWGLSKGTVVKEKKDEKYNTGLTQYKLRIDIDRNNRNKDYGFWFCDNQLHKFYFFAIVGQLYKMIVWDLSKIFKTYGK